MDAADHDTLVRLEGWSESVTARLDAIALEQRRLPRRVANRVGTLMTRRAALLFGIGALVGSSLGSAAGPAVQRIVLLLLGAH